MKATALFRASSVALLAIFLIAGCRPNSPIDYGGPVAQWPQWGNSEGGLRHSLLTQITPENVRRLKVAWTYRTGDIPFKQSGGQYGEVGPFFEATPIVDDERMYLCTPTNRVIALDPETGRQLWSYDPKLNRDWVTSHFNCRGVTFYRDESAKRGAACATRIITGTLDGRLIALDAANGHPCVDFGNGGTVDLLADLGEVRKGEYGATSPPVVIADRIVIGGLISDYTRIDVPAGVVRAFDVHTGALAWGWNPLPPGVTDRELAPPGEKYARGTSNAWGVFSVDRTRNLVFLPVANTSGDFFGGDRHGLDYYSSSVVALDGATGKVVWHFQTVHHDVWSLDAAAQPVLFDFPTDQGPVPAVAQAGKQGYLFILNRETGEPLVPVEERPVPQDGAVPGEHLSPTQPTPSNSAYILERRRLSADTAWGFTPWDRAKCRTQLRNRRSEGLYTPLSLEGSVNPVGWSVVNWGGFAIDPERQMLIINSMHVPSVLRLVPTDKIAAGATGVLPEGSRYAFTGDPLISPFGASCGRPPWGKLTAIDLHAGKRVWEIPLGTTRDIAPFPFWTGLGAPNMGGPITTASGLVFIAATTDDKFRAFELASGKKLWQTRLPAGGQAVPITYRLRPGSKQYVVIAAGGHHAMGTKPGDYVIAYALVD